MHVTICIATSNTPLPTTHCLARDYGSFENTHQSLKTHNKVRKHTQDNTTQTVKTDKGMVNIWLEKVRDSIKLPVGLGVKLG